VPNKAAHLAMRPRQSAVLLQEAPSKSARTDDENCHLGPNNDDAYITLATVLQMPRLY
jgi:hypothetical protein